MFVIGLPDVDFTLTRPLVDCESSSILRRSCLIRSEDIAMVHPATRTGWTSNTSPSFIPQSPKAEFGVIVFPEVVLTRL